MKHLLHVFLFTLFWIVLVGFSYAQQPGTIKVRKGPECGCTTQVDAPLPEGGYGNLKGKVSIPDDESGTGCVCLQLMKNGEVLHQASSHPSGAYIFDLVPAGSYRLVASWGEYKADYRGVIINSRKITFLDMELHQPKKRRKVE